MSNAELSTVRRAAGAAGRAARWGDPRGHSRQIRVSDEAAEALASVPERYRREVASAAVIAAAERFVAVGAV